MTRARPRGVETGGPNAAARRTPPDIVAWKTSPPRASGREPPRDWPPPSPDRTARAGRLLFGSHCAPPAFAIGGNRNRPPSRRRWTSRRRPHLPPGCNRRAAPEGTPARHQGVIAARARRRPGQRITAPAVTARRTPHVQITAGRVGWPCCCRRRVAAGGGRNTPQGKASPPWQAGRKVVVVLLLL